MTQKERLVDILYEAIKNCDINVTEVADYLLSNGVIVPPCKVGDTVYRLERNLCGDPVSQNVEFIWFTKDQIVLTTKSWNVSTAWLGNDFYLTREAAEQALKERDE